MKVIKRKRYILNHRGRIRSSKFPPSRYCGCVTAPAKVLRVVSDLFFQLFVCLFSQFHQKLWNKRLFLSSLDFIGCGAVRIRETYSNPKHLRGLRNRHEFYQQPATLLRKATRLSTLAREYTISFKASKIGGQRFS